MRNVELLDVVFRERALQVRRQVVEFPPPAKVVDQDESAAREVLLHSRDLIIGQLHVPDLAQISEWVLEQVRISEAEDVLVLIYHDRELGELGENLRKVEPGFRIIVRPGYAVVSQVLARIDLPMHY